MHYLWLGSLSVNKLFLMLIGLSEFSSDSFFCFSLPLKDPSSNASQPEAEGDACNQVCVPDPELLIKHPLHNRWALWYYKNDKTKDWLANLKLVTSFDTVEDFWAWVCWWYMAMSMLHPVSHCCLPSWLPDCITMCSQPAELLLGVITACSKSVDLERFSCFMLVSSSKFSYLCLYLRMAFSPCGKMNETSGVDAG